MKEFYIVLVTVALINCIGLSRITGPGCWLTRPGGWVASPGVAFLFVLSTATLLVATTLFALCVLTIIGYSPDLRAPPWLVFALSTISAALLLLPLAAWIQRRFALPSQRLRRLLPVAAVEAAILTCLLLTRTDTGVVATLLWALSAGAGLVLMVTVFGGLRLRLSVTDAAKSWRGLPLELVVTGILALVLLSPAGAIT